MTDEIFVSGKTYVSSKKAATESGYAQDYIGQLARKGLIDAQRVGGLWYIHYSSLTSYKQNADIPRPQPAVGRDFTNDPDSVVNFDGKDYVSASRAAKITGYNQDYVGQLARGGKILSRQIGNRWYIDREGLVTHKKEKDALLAKVQSEAVGLKPFKMPQDERKTINLSNEPLKTHFSYVSETRDLMPVLAQKENNTREETLQRNLGNAIAIRKIHYNAPKPEIQAAPRQNQRKSSVSKLALSAGAALSISIVLAMGLSTIKDGSRYALSEQNSGVSTAFDRFSASAASAWESLAGMIENIVSPEILYDRNLQ